jgi:hypothetical protein
MNDRKAPHLKAAAMLARDSARNKQFAGSGAPIPSRGLQKHPATPGTVARQDIVVGGMTTRTGCPASECRKNRSTDTAGPTPCGLHKSSKGNQYAGRRPSPSSGASGGLAPY